MVEATHYSRTSGLELVIGCQMILDIRPFYKIHIVFGQF
jgi:hypothetical protein